ncbi:MAG: hypothetical protein RIT27_1163 [Pseudomonadota bacterium]|jgi:hypothetical protein
MSSSTWDKKPVTIETYRAWVLNFGRGLRAAVSFNEMSQVLLEPSLFVLPHSPRYCSQLYLRNHQLLPVIHIPALLTAGKEPPANTTYFLGLAVYQTEPYAPLKYGCLHLDSLPVAVEITNTQSCTLPEDQPLWQMIAISAFSHENQKIPVLDLAALFSAELRQEVS